MSPLLLAAGSISLLNDAKPRVILSTKTLCGILDEVRPQLAYRAAVTWVVIDGEVPGYSSYASLCAAASVTEPTNKVEAGDLITKGIVHTHFIRAMYAGLMSASWRMSPIVAGKRSQRPIPIMSHAARR